MKEVSEADRSNTVTINCESFPGWKLDPDDVDSLRKYAREFPSTGARYASVCQIDCSAQGRRVSASGERYDFWLSATGELNIYEGGDTTYYVCDDYRCYRFLHFYHGHKSPDVLLSPAACHPGGIVDTFMVEIDFGDAGKEETSVFLHWVEPFNRSGEYERNLPMAAHVRLHAARISELTWTDVYTIGRTILQELPEEARTSSSNYLALTILGGQRNARGVMLRIDDGEVMFHLCEEYDQ